MKLFKIKSFYCFCLLIFFSTFSWSQEIKDTVSNPLADFSRLIGGEWHLGDSYQTFEWGVGKKSVKAKGFFMIEGKPVLVSEGSWFYHPGKQQIKAHFTAINMPVDFFEYTTRFEGDQMTNELNTFDSNGNPEHYKETWVFDGRDQYQWTLYSASGEKLMDGIYIRKGMN